MKLLADENVPAAVIEALRSAGHDTVWVREESPGKADPEVLRSAVAEGRLLVTLDKDFGELAFRARLPATCGVVLVRTSQASPSEMARVIVTALQSRDDWVGRFAVVENDRIRMTPLPSAPSDEHGS